MHYELKALRNSRDVVSLRLEATDIDWAHGSGPTVRGSAEALLLAMTGRTAALRHLDGDGVGALGGRAA